MVPDEGDILNFSPIRQKRNTHPRKENNCGDKSSMVILDVNNTDDTTTVLESGWVGV